MSDIDIRTCEACGAEAPGEAMHSTLDGVDICPTCWAAWEHQMQTCQHRWHPAPGYGPDARWCEDCSLVEGISDD